MRDRGRVGVVSLDVRGILKKNSALMGGLRKGSFEDRCDCLMAEETGDCWWWEMSANERRRLVKDDAGAEEEKVL